MVFQSRKNWVICQCEKCMSMWKVYVNVKSVCQCEKCMSTWKGKLETQDRREREGPRWFSLCGAALVGFSRTHFCTSRSSWSCRISLHGKTTLVPCWPDFYPKLLEIEVESLNVGRKRCLCNLSKRVLFAGKNLRSLFNRPPCRHAGFVV